MKNFKALLCIVSLAIFSCNNDDDVFNPPVDEPIIDPEIVIDPPAIPLNTDVNFEFASTIQVGGEGAAEISTFDATTNRLFVVNSEASQVSVYDLTDISNPTLAGAIPLANGGALNSVTSFEGTIAVAVEATIAQNNGEVQLYNATDLSLINSYTVGALPDMVTFTPDGNYLFVANEGEPNDAYTIDPEGTVSIIEIATGNITNLDFNAFNGQEATLEANGFRVFGPNANLAQDVEPEFITISDDSQTAWVALQENNGFAKIDIPSKTITDILPLGFKDHSLPGNEIDPSDRDDVTVLRSVPVFGMYQPDAITYVNINGTGYVISANEGDARDYDGFSEEERIDDLVLDPTIFPNTAELQLEENLGRLEITTTLGDTDGDGEFEELYAYGARSFTIWSENGDVIHDSGNSIGEIQLANTPATFNDEDGRSDAKGAEPESVEVLNIGDERYILFVGLERTDQIFVYDITNPNAPQFLSILSTDGDEAPEGLIAIPATDSPSGRDLVIVSNEDSGTVTIYQNNN